MRLFLAAALAFAPLPVLAQPAPDPVAPILAEAGPGTRWGVLVVDEEGREVLSVDPDRRFVPASNTKLYTTAAALWAEARGDGAKLEESGAAVRLDGADVMLTGRGDARLSGAPGCVTDCLAMLADAVAARTRRVRDIIGDATLFPDQRWSPGMSWNNIPTSSGTGIAALSIDDNEVAATITAGAIGAPPAVTGPAAAYYRIDNRARTVAGGVEALAYDRAANGRVLVVTGTIGAARPPVTWKLGIDDPAHFAAWQLAAQLRARGVVVTGEVRSRYRPIMPEDDPEQRAGTPPVRVPQPVLTAALTPGPLRDNVTTINKVSQNLHAELLLRRLGLAEGSGSIADGMAVVNAMLAEAGVAKAEASLSDGSGMSSYNRVTPRATVGLLRFAARQQWGDVLRASLPVGGVDGTLARRFVGTPLAGKIFAKTGTLNGTNALAGWLTAASGRTLTFAIYANDVPEDVRATAIMDRALVALAAAN